MATEQAQAVIKALEKDEALMIEYEEAIFASAKRYDESLRDIIDRVVGDLITNEAGELTSENANEAVFEELERQITNYYIDETGEQLTKPIVGTFQERMNTVNHLVVDAGLDDMVVDRPQDIPEVIDAVRVFEDKVTVGTDWSVNEFRAALLQVRADVRDGIGLEEFRERLVTKAGVLPRYAKTVGDTQLGAVDRIIRRKQAEQSAGTQLKYAGPLDQLTRPFCVRQMGKVRAPEEWDSMNNNTGPQPVSTYCGGWFCRHRLVPYKKEWDEVEDEPLQGQKEVQDEKNSGNP